MGVCCCLGVVVGIVFLSVFGGAMRELLEVFMGSPKTETAHPCPRSPMRFYWKPWFSGAPSWILVPRELPWIWWLFLSSFLDRFGVMTLFGILFRTAKNSGCPQKDTHLAFDTSLTPMESACS